MEFRVLGPLEVWSGDREIVVPAGRQRALLAALLLRANQIVSTDELAIRIWDNALPGDPRATTQTYVRRLRGFLGDGLIQTRPDGYLLAVAADRLDLARFDALLAQARVAGDPVAEAALLADALALWRGPALANVPSSSLHRDEVPALDERRLSALERLIDLELDAGAHAEAAARLRRLTAEHPLRERFWAQLMRALVADGRTAEALRSYQEVRARLADELGIDPGPELQELHRATLRGEPAARARATDVHIGPAQLPADVAVFTGRMHDLKWLDALLEDEPAAVAVAVVEGMAGIGKTALAVHWAHENRHRFPGGQLYVNLRGFATTTPVRPIEALAGLLRALGVPPGDVPVDLGEAAALYRSRLAGSRTLIVLDNAGSVEQIRPLLPGDAGCFVLVTSRDRLTGLVARDGAHRLTLDVLTADEAGTLLARTIGVDRVHAEPRATAELGRLCAYLPLALRIAAANLTDYPYRTIAAHVAELARGDRLTGLQIDGDQDSAVRAAFDLSCRAIPDPPRRLFRMLGLVPGPDVTPAAAAALVDTSPEEARSFLDRLVAAHLLDQHASDRYTLHDLLRLYAEEQSTTYDTEPQRAAAVERLLDWYIYTAEVAATVLYPQVLRLTLPVINRRAAPAPFRDSAEALSWLDAEWTNLVAAIQHAATHGPRQAAWLLADRVRGYLWLRRDIVAWQMVARAALTAAESAGDQRAQSAARRSLGDFDLAAGRYSDAVEQYTTALTLARQAGWAEAHAGLMGTLGVVFRSLGQPRQAAEHHAQGLALARQIGHRYGEALGLSNLGVACAELGQLLQAADHSTEGLALFRQLGAHSAAANVLGNLGRLERLFGRFGRAAERLNEALSLHREVGQRTGEATALEDLAALHRDLGNHTRAYELAQAAVAVANKTDDGFFLAATLNTLGTVQLHLGRPQQAIKMHRRALDLAQQSGDRGNTADALLGLAAAQRRTGQRTEAFAHAVQALTIAEHSGYLVREGHARIIQAQLHLDRNEYYDALAQAQQGLAIQQQTGHRLGQAHAFTLLARIRSILDGPQAALAHHRAALDVLTEIGVPALSDDLSAT